MYGETFYGLHTAQHQWQWSKCSFKSRKYIQKKKLIFAYTNIYDDAWRYLLNKNRKKEKQTICV